MKRILITSLILLISLFLTSCQKEGEKESLNKENFDIDLVEGERIPILDAKLNSGESDTDLAYFIYGEELENDYSLIFKPGEVDNTILLTFQNIYPIDKLILKLSEDKKYQIPSEVKIEYSYNQYDYTLMKSKVELFVGDNDFKGYMKCAICGKAYTYKKTPYNVYWMCSTARTKGKKYCKSKQVPDSNVKEGIMSILNVNSFNKNEFIKKIKTIVVHESNKLVFELIDGTSKKYLWEHDSRANSWTEEMKEKARIKALKRNKGGI